MKTLELIASLNGRERKEFASVIKTHKRATLQMLFKTLLKCVKSRQEVDKQWLYAQVFGEAYCAQKDYLIRNELRKLNNELLSFVIRKTLQSEVESNPGFRAYWLCETLQRRKLHRLFDLEFTTALNHTESRGQSRQTSELYRMKINQLERMPKIRKSLIDEIIRYCQCAILWLKKDFLNSLRLLEEKLIQAQYYERRLGRNVEFHNPITNIDLTQPDIITDYGQQQYYLILAYSSDDNQITYYEKALRYAERLRTYSPPHSNIETIRARLALAYTERNNLEAAAAQYIALIDYSECAGRLPMPPIVTNYVYNRIQSRDFSTAHELCNRYEAYMIDSRPSEYSFFILKSFIHFHLNQPQKALDCVNRKRTNMNAMDKFGLRFIRIMALYKSGLIDAAIHELCNVKKFVQYSTNLPREFNFTGLVRLLQRFLRAIDTPDPTECRRKLLLVENQIDSVAGGMSGLYKYNNIYLQLIRDEMRASACRRVDAPNAP